MFGSTSATRLTTLRPVMTSTPRLPVKALAKKRQSRMGIGWSSPISLTNCLTSSGVACGPSRVTAGSPGTIAESRNKSSIAPKTIATVVTKREKRYRTVSLRNIGGLTNQTIS